ncbi:MAG: MarC family protein [Leptolyngbyaceae cyanobacterium MO_188.B28]|nr:MarC family protein [Leptolyngbyaceae cyanobacterium MO_188.B28]
MDQLLSYAAITFLGLFPIANPIGVVPTFYRLTFGNSPSRRGSQARQVAINVIVVLTTFLIAGQLILSFFGLSLGALQVSGGLLIAHTAWRMVTVNSSPSLSNEDSSKEGDITLIPMAVPIISGPGAIGMVMGLIAKDPQPINYAGSLLGIVGIGVLVYLCLALGEPLIRVLGRNGVDALTRILGFFILAIAIQLMANGAASIIGDLSLADVIAPTSASIVT